MKSWKTTAAGALGAIATFLVAQENGTLKLIGQILSGVSVALLGLFARDNNVTSEQAGATDQK